MGEELRIGTSADWREWQRPGNAIEISRGKAGPRFVRRNIDAVANAGDFGGGIRAAGSNRGDAGNLIDESLGSFWAPGDTESVRAGRIDRTRFRQRDIPPTDAL